MHGILKIMYDWNLKKVELGESLTKEEQGITDKYLDFQTKKKKKSDLTWKKTI